MDTVQIRFALQDDVSSGLKRLVVPIEDVKSAMDKATKAAKETTSMFDKLAATCIKINNVREAIAGVSDAIDGFLAPSRDFEDAMLKVNTMAGLNEAQFEEMRSAIRDLSKDVPMSAAALSEGMYAVISNGFEASEQMEVLRASARSAIGGCADLSKGKGVTANVVKNYGLTGDYAATVQDKIQLAAKNGVTSFEELSAALPAVTANAATLGVSVDELLASYATLTGVSGNTAAVSTQLGAIFTALAKPSSEASRLAAEMGVQFDAAAIRAAGGMQNFLTSLSADIDTYAARSGMLRETIVATLFGSAEAVKAFTPITGELATKFGENVAAMTESAGTMDFAFEQMSQTSEARAQSWANTFGGMADFVQNHFETIITGVQRGLEALGGISSALPAIELLHGWLGKSATAQRIWTAVTTTASAVAKAMAGGVRNMVTAIVRSNAVQKVAAAVTSGMTAAQLALNAAMAANPIGLIITGIVLLVGLLVAGIRACINNFKTWGETVLMLMGPIGWVVAAFVKHWDSIKKAFTDGGIIGGLKRIGIVLLDVLLLPLQHLLDLLSKIPGLGKLAAKGSDMLHGLRERLNLTEGEAKVEVTEKAATDPATGKPKEAARPVEAARPTVGVGEAVGKTAARATAQQSQIKRIDITIDKVVESFTVNSTTLQQGAADIRDMVARALVDAVNDVNYAL